MNKFKLVTLFGLSLALGACGGGGSSSPGVTPPPAAVQPTPVTTYGKLTGFGSVYVNGVEFETDAADYDVNGRQGVGDDDFSVGMVVTIKGTVNPDGVTGIAESVSYDEEIEGPVTLITPDPVDPTVMTISVFGMVITLDGGTKFEAESDPAFGFSTITVGDNVQVSGVFHGAMLTASYIEKQDASDDTFEVEGTVSLFDSVDNFTLTLSNGSVIDVTLSAAGATLPAAGIVDGQYVEVEGTIPDPAAPNAMSATKVELQDEDHFDDQDDEIGIKGPLTLTRDLELNTDTWSIDGTEISFSDSTEYDPANLIDSITDGSADGIIVKVEGSFVNGVLQAEEVSNEDDSIELKAVFESVAAGATTKSGTITVSFGGAMGTLDVIVDGTTFFMDDDAITPFDLTTLPAGTVVEIDGKQNAAGAVVASKLGIDDGMEIEIAGPVEAITDVSITVLGIEFIIDPVLTEFPDGMPGVGVTASIEDATGDGTAEKVEIDD